MRGDRPSLTAALVALARASHVHAPGTLRRGSEIESLRFLSPGFASAWLSAGAVWSSPGITQRVLHGLSLGFVEHAVLRTAAIDAAVVDAVASGCRQLVILGAGLDARAWRMPELAGTTVFEVDFATTQRFKRERAVPTRALATAVRFVPVDFARDSLGDALASAAHDPEAPTVWIWEGVTVYLERAAIEATLAHVAARSCVGSRVLMTYVPPEMLGTSRGASTLLRAIGLAIGEPVRGVLTRDEAMETFWRFGFQIVDDTTTADWALRFWGASAPASVRDRERLAVAVRVPSSAVRAATA